jgi:hypothetical protein
VSDSIRTIAVAAAALGLAFGWLAVRTARTPVSSHERLVAELRMTQLASLILVLLSGAFVGFAAWQDSRLGAGLDVAFALGFVAVAFAALTRDPRESLTLLAVAFAGHALVDLAHGPGWLPSGVAPRWYLVGCASFNLYLGALCYLPLLKR